LTVDDKLVCDSKATYGKGGDNNSTLPGMAGDMGGGGHGHGGAGGKDVEHITSMSACYGDELGVTQLKKGQKWLLQAYYDYNKYVPLPTVVESRHADKVR
jgi:hypothetical protein